MKTRQKIYQLFKEGKDIDYNQIRKEQQQQNIKNYLNNPHLLEEQGKTLKQYLDYVTQVKKGKLRTQVSTAGNLVNFALFIKKGFLQVTKSDIYSFVRFLREKGNQTILEKSTKKTGLKDTSIRLKVAIIKTFLQWLKDNSIDSLEETYRTKIENEPNLALQRKIEDERNALETRLIRNFNHAFPKTLYFDLGLMNLEQERYAPEQLLTGSDVNAMLSACYNMRDRALIALLSECGFRIHELLGIRMKDIAELGSGFKLHIDKDTKTGERDVAVKISAPILKSWLNQHPQNNNPNAYLFIALSNSWRGLPLRYAGALSIISRAMKSAGVNKPIHSHLFRHSITTQELESGVNPDDIRIKRGWKRDSKMLFRYTHRSSTKLAEQELGISKAEKITELKTKMCSVCGKHAHESSMYCECGGVLLDKAEADLEKKKQLAFKLIEELVDLEGGKELLNKAKNKILGEPK